MNPKNKKDIEKIKGEYITEDEFEEFFDFEKDGQNFSDFKKLLHHQKETGYFYPDNDDDELIIDDEYGYENDEIESFEEKLDKTYKSYYEIFEEKGNDKNEQ